MRLTLGQANFTLASAVIFKFIFIWPLLCLSAMLTAQSPDTSAILSREDSMSLMAMDSLWNDSAHVEDTLFYAAFVPYDHTIWRNSKINLRKTLTASKNPPFRKSLNNYLVVLWAFFITLLIIFFKANYALQYRLLNKSWYSSISFNEFFSTQTSVFKNSKILTWFIISQCVSLGLYIVIKASYNNIEVNDLTLVFLISVAVIALFVANQWLKNLFAFSFYQPSLSRDYAIIYRIHAYITALFLVPVLLLLYYNGASNLKTTAVVSMVVYILVVYALSLFKFIFSGRFLQNQSNFILILYLCAFEILPLLVLIKSINNLLEYD